MSVCRAAYTTAALISVCLALGSQTKDGQKINIPKQLPDLTKRQMTIEPIGASDWHKSAKSSRKLIEATDKWLATLKGVSANSRLVFSVGEKEGFGMSLGDIAVETPKKFRANYGQIYRSLGGYAVKKATLISDGSKFQKDDQSGKTTPVPVTASRLPKSILTAFPENCQELLFAGLGTNDRPLTAYYQAAKAAGYRIVTQHRSGSIQGQNFDQDRVVLTGNSKSGGLKTAYTVEFLIDSTSGALLKITVSKLNSESTYKAFWTVRWNRTAGQVFPETLFTVVKR